MSVDRFRFVSPGIFINEIDQSQIPRDTVRRTGPAIIGRTEHGPGLVPTTVRTFNEFVELFGNPIPGGKSGDVWREGNYSAPTYAAYAAQAYLRNNSPVTVVRLLGDQSPQAGSSNTAKAGWFIKGNANNAPAGTYGLWICNSASAADINSAHVTGTLAAVWYLTGSATIALAGTSVDGTTMEANSTVINNSTAGGSKELKVVIRDGGTNVITSTFNFDDTSARYIRKVFNTNPQLLNSNVTNTANQESYFLGESYGRNVRDLNLGSSDFYGIILGLGSGSSYTGGDHRFSYKLPETPPIISQDTNIAATTFDLNNTPYELFKLVARNEAEWLQNNLKVSITDIKQSPNPEYNPYGTFTVQIRKISDSDSNPQIVEQFNNLNLNPNSPNFIARRIGDKYVAWDTTHLKWNVRGEYDNLSRYARVSMLFNGSPASEDLLPFGFKGLPKNDGFNYLSGNVGASTISLGGNGSATGIAWAEGSGSIMSSSAESQGTPGYFPWIDAGTFGASIGPVAPMTMSLQFPMLPLRLSSSDNGVFRAKDAYWGLTTQKSRTSDVFDGTIRDIVRCRPEGSSRITPSLAYEERGPGFTLDNLVEDKAVGGKAAVYSGSNIGYSSADPGGGRADGASMTAVSASYQEVLDQGYNRFTVPFFGGFDGFDIQEKEPFNNTRALGGEGNAAPNEVDNAMFYTCKKAIDGIADPDQLEINLAAIPGITVRGVTNHLLRVCEDRADALAVIDLEGGFTSSAEDTASFGDRAGSSAQTVSYIKARALNNSYGAAYYPWVQVSDTISGVRVWVPPSVAAIGTYASSAARSELWFAPAGFNRGGLSQGSAGIPVVGVVDKLTSDQRDDLYEVNINPIASFPAEGIVIFGQKTLQATPSALDRINVRRLMIFLKKQISRIAATILFDPNVQVTWDRFTGQVQPLLRSVKSRFGLSEYRVILDSSTTTPELIDRNILYAKVLLKPTRAIEFIALDFVISRTGASFDD